MIVYELRCSGDHAFEAWFRDSTAFDEQAAEGAIVCPDCGDTAVRKAPMAPRIAKGRGKAGGEGGATRTYAHAKSAETRRALAELRRQVEESCDYVGDAFAEEARKIHYGEVEERAIYGETSDEDAEALREEGVQIRQVPWLPRGDS